METNEKKDVATTFENEELNKLYDASRDVRMKASGKEFYNARGIILSVISAERFNSYVKDGSVIADPTDDEKAEADYVIEKSLITFKLDGKGRDSGIIPTNQIKNPRDEYFDTQADFLFQKYVYTEDGKNGKKGDARLNLHSVTVKPSRLSDEDKLKAAAKYGFTMFNT